MTQELERTSDVQPANPLPKFKSEDWSEAVETARALLVSLDNHKWQLAAVCASVERVHGEASLSQFASEVGLSTSTVYAYAQTYKAFEDSERSEILSFHHHTVSSTSDDPPGWISTAETEQLSTRELDRRIQGKEDENLVKCPECNGRGRVPKMQAEQKENG